MTWNETQWWGAGLTPGLYGYVCVEPDGKPYTEGINEAVHWGNTSCCCDACKPDHHVAMLACTCGIHGAWDMEDVPGSYHDARDVAGVIEGFGTVSLGRKGFRASRGRIVALVEPPDVTAFPLYMSTFDRTLLHKLYPSVPFFQSLDELLAEYPVTDPTELLGASHGMG